MPSIRIKAKNYTSIVIRSIHLLSIEELFRKGISDFIFNYKLATYIRGVELLKARVKATIILVGVYKFTLY